MGMCMGSVSAPLIEEEGYSLHTQQNLADGKEKTVKNRKLLNTELLLWLLQMLVEIFDFLYSFY